MCNHFVDFLIKRDKRGKLHFASLQGKTAAELLEPEDIKDLSSVVFKTDDRVYKYSTASIKATSQLGGIYKLALVLLIIPPFIRNTVYNFIAKNRIKWFGQREDCRIPTEGEESRILD